MFLQCILTFVGTVFIRYYKISVLIRRNYISRFLTFFFILKIASLGIIIKGGGGKWTKIQILPKKKILYIFVKV
jgi:hypothetical protein